MHLFIADRLVRNPSFFSEAHYWLYKRSVDTSHSVLEFKICGIIPDFVRQYVEHIQGKERENAVQTLQRTDRGG